ncbi:MAG: hypothetical protein WD226_12240 [Planctomycetota bacterium]
MRRQIERWVDRELPVAALWRLEDHLGECSACRWYAARLGGLEAALEAADDPPVSARELEHAVASVRARLVRERTTAPRRWQRPVLARAAAAVVVLAASAWVLVATREATLELDGSNTKEIARAASGEAQAEACEPEALAPSDSDRLAAILAEHAAYDDDALLAALAAVRPGRSRVRLIEDAVVAGESPVARGAARVLALEVDLLSLRALRRAWLERRDRATLERVADALVAFGERGASSLALGLEGEGRALAVRSLVRVGDETAVHALEADWKRRLQRGADAGDVLGALLDVDAAPVAFGSFQGLADEAAREAGLSALRREPRARAPFAAWLSGRGDIDAALWRYARIVEFDQACSWLVARIEDRRTRRKGLACLEHWSPESALFVWFELADRGLGDDELRTGFERALAESPAAGVALVERVLREPRDSVAVARLVERLLEVGDATAGPALRALLLRADRLPDGAPRWVALALAEVGDAAIGKELALDLRRGLALDRFARAAAWLAVERTAGADALEPLLTDLAGAARARVKDALRSPSTAGLARIARVLDHTVDTVAQNQTP